MKDFSKKIGTLYFTDYIEIDDDMWFSASNCNGLFRYDKKKGITSFIAFFEGEKFTKSFLHSKIIYHNNCLFFVPFQAKALAVYDIKNDTMTKIDVPDGEGGWSFFHCALLQEEDIYLIPCRYESVLRFNCQTYEFEVVASLDRDRWKEKEVYVIKAALIKEGKLYIGSFQEDLVFVIDIVSRESYYIDISEEMFGITHLLPYQDEMILIGKKGKICRCNWSGEVLSTYQISEIGNKREAFYDAILKKEKLYLSCVDLPAVYCYDVEKKDIEKISIDCEDVKGFDEFYGEYLFLKDHDQEGIKVQSARNGAIYAIDGNQEIIYRYQILWQLTQDDEERIGRQIRYISDENVSFSLGIDILNLWISNIGKVQVEQKSLNNGCHIWEKMKEI